MLDLSAAFDLVDHDILLQRLHLRFGLCDTVLKWVTSYLKNRTQVVSIDGIMSKESEQDCSVPQGAVLGADMYSDYTAPVTETVEPEVDDHYYFDDSQFLNHFIAGDINSEEIAVNNMEASVLSVKQWMSSNLLKRNDKNTEVLIIGQKKQLDKTNISQIRIGDTNIKPSESARNIGAILDSTMSLQEQISNTCKRSWYHLYNIRKIRKYLTTEATKTLVHAFITSRLDTLNSLLYGLPKYQIKRLQIIQNCAARTVTQCNRYDHITPVLKSLHWLPVQQRIEYSIILRVFKIKIGQQPDYISELLTPTTSQYNSRSSTKLLYNIPRTRCKTMGDRAFSVCAPRLWNEIPESIKKCLTVDDFKKKLKT